LRICSISTNAALTLIRPILALITLLDFACDSRDVEPFATASPSGRAKSNARHEKLRFVYDRFVGSPDVETAKRIGRRGRGDRGEHNGHGESERAKAVRHERDDYTNGSRRASILLTARDACAAVIEGASSWV
jgi:hypothetical protein